MGSAEVQGELWSRDPGGWSRGMEPRIAPLFTAMLDAVDPIAGQRLLDSGCGAGLSARLASGRGAVVAGVDAAPGLLEVARSRTPDGDFRVGDIEALPYNEATFDVVTATNSIQYATDPAVAVSELARVCKSGGKVVIGIWGDPQRCETEALFGRLRSLAPPPPGTPAPLAVSEPGMVEELLEKAGLLLEGGAEVPCPIAFVDHDEAWAAHQAAGPLQRIIDVAGADAVRTIVHDVLEADRKPTGELRQDNVFRYVLARKP